MLLSKANMSTDLCAASVIPHCITFVCLNMMIRFIASTVTKKMW